MSTFADYVEHGWKLCRIQRGLKGPRSTGWNRLENTITAVEHALHLESAGLCHAYSGTCAIDIDNEERTAALLEANGIDLYELMHAPDAVRITSGRANRGKLIYRLPEPLPTKMFSEDKKVIFELRCGTRTGHTAQDVLPPSKHPSGSVYEWVGDWRKLPLIPDTLLAFWKKELGPGSGMIEGALTPRGQASLAELEDMLSRRDPDCSYDDWIKIGMAIHHELEGSPYGLAAWDEWSSSGKKYPGFSSLRSHWDSFGSSANPVTSSVLRKGDIATADEFDAVSSPGVVDAAVGNPDWLQEVQNENALTPKKEQFRFLPLAELFLRPKPDWMIPNILPYSAMGSVWGQSMTGKSFVCTDLALTIALGQLWQSKSVERGECLYVAAEDDIGIQSRLASGLLARGATDLAPIFVLPGAPVLTSKEQGDALLESIQNFRPKLIFFDTLAAVTPGSDENSGKDMGQVLHYCHRIHKATGGLVLLVHHEGKQTGKGPRGWSGLRGRFEVEWEVTHEDGVRKMDVVKLKNAPTGMSYEFRLAPIGDSCTVQWL